MKMRENYMNKNIYIYLTTIYICHNDSVDCRNLSYVLKEKNTTRAKIHDIFQPPSASCKPRHPSSALLPFIVGSYSQVVLGFGPKV